MNSQRRDLGGDRTRRRIRFVGFESTADGHGLGVDDRNAVTKPRGVEPPINVAPYARRTATQMANGGIWRNAAALGEFRPPVWNGGSDLLTALSEFESLSRSQF